MTRARRRPFPLAVLMLGCVLAAPRVAAADPLADLRTGGVLRWGGDQEGGGPYVFPRDDDPARVTGFEVDLAAALAASLSVKPEFTQAQWERLPDMLRTRKVHVILNGYELTPERGEQMAATIPYYVYALQLLARKGDPHVGSWDSLKRHPDSRVLRVGALTGSAAEEKLRQFCQGACDVVSYDGNTDAMREVETGKLDATVQDTPIAAFYAPRFPGLAAVGAPVEKGYYVAYVARNDTALLDALNQSLVQMVRNGEIERIERRYGIWDERQAELSTIAKAAKFYGYQRASAASAPRMAQETGAVIGTHERKHGLAVVRDYAGILIASAGLTVVLSLLSFPLAVGLGLLIAVGRVYGPRWLGAPLRAYVELLRGTPLMLQLYFLFFMLPEIGIALPAFWTGVFGLAVNYSAYESEIYRSGLQAIPPGQMEAALSLGMSRWMAIRRIVVPQAVRMVVPPVMNDFIALFKDTSVCSVITLVELTKRFSVLSMSTQATIELMTMTALLYLGMSFPMSLLSRRLEQDAGKEARA